MVEAVMVSTPESDVRIVAIEGVPWMVAEDIALIVGGTAVAHLTRNPAALLAGHCRACDLDGTARWLLSADALPHLLDNVFVRKGLETWANAVRSLFKGAPEMASEVEETIAFVQQRPAPVLGSMLLSGLARVMGYLAIREAERAAEVRQADDAEPRHRPAVSLRRPPIRLPRR